MRIEECLKLAEKRKLLSDGDSHLICLLADEVLRLRSDFQAALTLKGVGFADYCWAKGYDYARRNAK